MHATSECTECGADFTADRGRQGARRSKLCPECRLYISGAPGHDAAMTWEEIAQEIGVSKARVQQIAKVALRKLARELAA